MARRVFFSFHHQNDSWRAAQVRNSRVTKASDDHTFIDAVEWEALQRKGEAAVKKWIDSQLERTTVTVVLVGKQTASRPFVHYEIEESFKRGNGLLAINIHGIKDQDGHSYWWPGTNPFRDHYVKKKDWFGFEYKVDFTEIYPTYAWFWDNGREHMAEWIEKAAHKLSRG